MHRMENMIVLACEERTLPERVIACADEGPREDKASEQSADS